jgi:hypothetical protein
MSVNEMSLPVRREKFSVSNRFLGLLGMIGAPMLFIFFIFGNIDAGAPKTLKDQIMSLTGVFYMGGWMMSAIAMRRLRVTGDGLGGKIVFIIQITLLSCALVFSVMEAFGYSFENGGLIYAVADAGYPLSHLFMNVVGIFVVRAKIWRGLPRYAPFIVGIALPVTLALMASGFVIVTGIFFGGMTTIGLGTIAYTVYRQSKKLS